MNFLRTLYGNPYMIIGIIVSLLNLRAIARELANSSNVWTGTHWASVRRKGVQQKPGIGDYIGATIWSFILIPAWPLTAAFRLWIMFSK